MAAHSEERLKITVAQKKAIRSYFKAQNPKLGHKHIKEWFKMTYGVELPFSTISNILSPKFNHLDSLGSDHDENKRCRPPKYPDLEIALSECILRSKNNGQDITGTMLLTLAYEIWPHIPAYRNMSCPGLSGGWVEKFKARHKFKQRLVVGEAASAYSSIPSPTSNINNNNNNNSSSSSSLSNIATFSQQQQQQQQQPLSQNDNIQPPHFPTHSRSSSTSSIPYSPAYGSNRNTSRAPHPGRALSASSISIANQAAARIAASKQTVENLRQRIAAFPADDVFSMSETQLAYRLLPNSSELKSSMASKETLGHVTVALACNSTGTQLLKPWVIGHYKSPRALPIISYTNSNNTTNQNNSSTNNNNNNIFNDSYDGSNHMNNNDQNEFIRPKFSGKSNNNNNNNDTYGYNSTTNPNPNINHSLNLGDVQYSSNILAWMTLVEWKKWLKWFDNEMGAQNRKALLILDPFKCHEIGARLMTEAQELKNTEIHFLPGNISHIHSPLEQGILQNFKANYRRDLTKFLCDYYQGNITAPVFEDDDNDDNGNDPQEQESSVSIKQESGYNRRDDLMLPPKVPVNFNYNYNNYSKNNADLMDSNQRNTNTNLGIANTPTPPLDSFSTYTKQEPADSSTDELNFPHNAINIYFALHWINKAWKAIPPGLIRDSWNRSSLLDNTTESSLMSGYSGHYNQSNLQYGPGFILSDTYNSLVNNINYLKQHVPHLLPDEQMLSTEYYIYPNEELVIENSQDHIQLATAQFQIECDEPIINSKRFLKQFLRAIALAISFERLDESPDETYIEQLEKCQQDINFRLELVKTNQEFTIGELDVQIPQQQQQQQQLQQQHHQPQNLMHSSLSELSAATPVFASDDGYGLRSLSSPHDQQLQPGYSPKRRRTNSQGSFGSRRLSSASSMVPMCSSNTSTVSSSGMGYSSSNTSMSRANSFSSGGGLTFSPSSNSNNAMQQATITFNLPNGVMISPTSTTGGNLALQQQQASSQGMQGPNPYHAARHSLPVNTLMNTSSSPYSSLSSYEYSPKSVSINTSSTPMTSNNPLSSPITPTTAMSSNRTRSSTGSIPYHPGTTFLPSPTASSSVGALLNTATTTPPGTSSSYSFQLPNPSPIGMTYGSIGAISSNTTNIKMEPPSSPTSHHSSLLPPPSLNTPSTPHQISYNYNSQSNNNGSISYQQQQQQQNENNFAPNQFSRSSLGGYMSTVGQVNTLTATMNNMSDIGGSSLTGANNQSNGLSLNWNPATGQPTNTNQAPNNNQNNVAATAEQVHHWQYR